VLREDRVEPRRAGDIEGHDIITAAGQRLDDPGTNKAATPSYKNPQVRDSAERLLIDGCVLA
jgi:hypothetical protein